MAVSGIGSSAWQYENVFTLKRNAAKQETSSKVQSSSNAENEEVNAVGGGLEAANKKTSVKEYVAELGAKYGVNISVYSGSDKSFMSTILGSSGTANLAISKNIAEKMMNDPELQKVIEEKLAKLPEEGRQIENDIKKMGHEVLGCGMQIDKNGRISYWAVSYDPDAAKKNAEAAKEKMEKIRKQQEQLLEKRKERKEQAERIEEQRAEKKEAVEDVEEKRAEKKESEAEKIRLYIAKGDTPEELAVNVNESDNEAIAIDDIVAGEASVKGRHINVSV